MKDFKDSFKKLLNKVKNNYTNINQTKGVRLFFENVQKKCLKQMLNKLFQKLTIINH